MKHQTAAFLFSILATALSLSRFGALAGPLDPPILTNIVALQFDGDSDGVNEFDYVISVGPDIDPNGEYHNVDFSLRSFDTGRYLKAAQSRVPFETVETISVAAQEFVTESGGN